MSTITTLARGCALAIGLATLSAAPAHAQSLQLDLNNGRLGVAPPPPPYERGPVIIERERGFGERDGYRISCGEGRRIVRQNGFRDVRPVDCGGRAFTYSAVRAGEPVEVRVSSRDGRIVSVERF